VVVTIPAKLLLSEFIQWVQCSLPVLEPTCYKSVSYCWISWTSGNDTLVICNRKPRFHLLLMTAKRKFWSFLTAPSSSWHKFMMLLLLVSEQLKHRLHKLRSDPLQLQALPQNCVSWSHKRHNLCQWSPKLYFGGLCRQFCKLSKHTFLCSLKCS
jgi:hypothetical protein